MQAPPLPFSSRIAFAWVCFFRVLFDGAFAGRAWAVRESMPSLPEPKPEEPKLAQPKPEPKAESKPTKPKESEAEKKRLRDEGSLYTLSIFQRDGRLIDFLKQDVTAFSDEEVGAAVRVVHAGCKKALDEHVSIEPVRSEDEGAKVTLEEDFDKAGNKLVGDVRGSAPFRGVLRHKGWRAKNPKFPTPTGGHDFSVLCPAEVEL